MSISSVGTSQERASAGLSLRGLSQTLRGNSARLAMSLSGLSLALIAGSAPAHAADLAGSFTGNAYAASASAEAGPISLSLGQVAYIPCPCNGTFGKTLVNEVATVSGGVAGSVIKAAAARSTIFTTKTSSSALIEDTSTIANLNLLGGLVTADAITAEANVSATATAITASSTGSTFLNLKVLGQPVDINVAPNTQIELPGIGFITLFKTTKSGNFTSSGQVTVEAISIVVNHTNTLGLGIGAKIVVAHAISGYNRSQPPAIVAGSAYAASANATIGTVLQGKIGQAAAVYINCAGTAGKTLTNTVASLSVGNILTLGTGQTTAFGGPLNGATVAKTTATVESVSLLGVIGATALKAVVTETFQNGVRSRSFDGSGFGAITVLGIPVPLNVAPNTTITLPLLGKVVINEQIVPTDSKRSQVNALHVTVGSSFNLLGLPVGTEIVVAHADAAALKF